MTPHTVWGLMLECLTPEELLAAVRQARLAGYRHMDAYSPYPVDGLAAELGLKRSRIPSIVLVGGLTGAIVGFWMQYYSATIDYPVNVGGRPHNSWPAFVPIAFEVTIFVAASAAFLGMLFLNGLPQPHHPVFNVPQFRRASQDRFLFCIEASDPLFNLPATAAFLRSTCPQREVLIVPESEPTDEELTASMIEIAPPAKESSLQQTETLEPR